MQNGLSGRVCFLGLSPLLQTGLGPLILSFATCVNNMDPAFSVRQKTTAEPAVFLLASDVMANPLAKRPAP